MALCRGHKEEALHWELKPSHLSPIWKHSELQPFITYTEEIKSEVITLDWFNAGRAHFSLKSLLSRNVHTSCRSVGTERLLPLFHSVCTGLMLWNPDDRLSTHMWTNIVLYFSLSPPDVSPSSPASFFLSFLCLFFFLIPLLSLQSTPLHLAAGYNRVRIVQLLLQHGADVHAKDKGYVQLNLLE